jgi:hypothetical protein
MYCNVPDPTKAYTLRVDNFGIASGIVSVNGQEIFGQDSFNPNVFLLEKRMMFQAKNAVTVRLNSKPGSSVKISILNQ